MKINRNEILSFLKINALNEMQLQSEKSILLEENTLLLSPTGSGKTLAFLLPILQLLSPDIKTIQCLIIVPSRELGLQIEQVWKEMKTSYKINICYGGHSIETEINNLKNPPALLIGTPGRLVDHLERKTFITSKISYLILDEFDKSLQLGFQDDMKYIIEKLSFIKKNILISATPISIIPDFINFKNPSSLNFISKESDAKNISTKLVLSNEKDKIPTLFQLICSLQSESALIFCNHRESTERISELLNKKGIYTNYYHGGMEQEERERALILFRNGSVRYLVTTDLAARGLDIPEVKHIIHYHLPAKEDEYVHRNGRTARMLTSGTIYILYNKEEKRQDFINYKGEILDVSNYNSLPKPPYFKTLYISGGKKNKLNKTDIVGFFTQKGQLQKEDIGLIVVKDFISFVAIKSNKIDSLLFLISNQKMKGKKYKIEVARDVLKTEEL